MIADWVTSHNDRCANDGLVANPNAFRRVHGREAETVIPTFGEWIIGSAETIRFYPIVHYATEITKQI